MKIRNFLCVGLNHFLNYDLVFHDDVSFLHGINGSGKTSILRAIASILTPDPLWLANTDFDKLRLVFEHKDILQAITVTKVDNSSLKISHQNITPGVRLPVRATTMTDVVTMDDVRMLSRYMSEDYVRHSPMDPDEYAVYMQRYIDANKTLAFISKLPTPIFLGLDRTTLATTDTLLSARGRARTPARAKTIHPYFRTQLDEAIWEAEKLLSRQLAILSNERNKIFEDLRNQFVLSLFRIPKENEDNSVFNPETLEGNVKYQQMLGSFTAALRKIDVKDEDITGTVEPFFRHVEQVNENAVIAMRQYRESTRKNKNQPTNFDLMQGIGKFMNMIPYLTVIKSTLAKIESSNRRESILSRPIDQYEKIINSFLSDSRKRLVFEENAVKVRLPSGELSELTSLSSGERQLFVLITHLVFSPAMRGENILLIDEPELSLHLKWQRQFVPAIRDASPATQMILATHSPEIIYNRVDKLIPLNG